MLFTVQLHPDLLPAPAEAEATIIFDIFSPVSQSSGTVNSTTKAYEFIHLQYLLLPKGLIETASVQGGWTPRKQLQLMLPALPQVLSISFIGVLTYLSVIGKHVKKLYAANLGIIAVNIWFGTEIFQHISEARERNNTDCSGGYQPWQTANHLEKHLINTDRKTEYQTGLWPTGQNNSKCKTAHREGK